MRIVPMAVATMATLVTAAAWADQMPREIIGTWTDQAACGIGAHKMLFSANTLTVVQPNGQRVSVQVDTHGNLDQRLEIRVTKVLAGAADPNGAHVGDVIVIRREKGSLHLIGHGDAGAAVQDDPSGPTLRRCVS